MPAVASPADDRTEGRQARPRMQSKTTATLAEARRVVVMRCLVLGWSQSLALALLCHESFREIDALFELAEPLGQLIELVETARSEEHTSELQSQSNLVCRLLLEKKIKRPGSREFAGITTHDPAGNVFDLSQPGMENRRDVYIEEERLQDRHIKHIALRTVNAACVAQFYREVLELGELEKPSNDPNFYFTDGRVVFMIMPWNIKDFIGTG